MGFARMGILALLAGLGAAGIVGCGSGGSLLSSSQAAQLTAQLNHVSQALNNGQCATAENDIAALEAQLQSLSGVNSTLLQNLNQGASTIQQLTQNRCSPASTTPKKTTTHTKTTATNTSTGTDTVATATNPSQTVTTITDQSTTSTTGGQGLPTSSDTSTTGGSGTGPTTTSATTTGTGTSTATTLTTTTTGSPTTTSPAGGATGL